MKTYVLDTNSLLRYLLDDIKEQAQETEKILLSAQQGRVKVVITVIVIMELVYALLKFYKWDRETVCENIKKLVCISLVEVEKREIVIEALGIYETGNISFVDSLLIAESRQIGGQIFTFDKKLKMIAEKMR